MKTIDERIETIMSEEIGNLDHPSFDLKYEIEAALKRMSLEQKAIDDKECETMVGAAAKEAQQVFIERGKEWLKHNIVKYAGMFKEHYEDELGRETIKVCPCVDAALYDDFEKAMKK